MAVNNEIGNIHPIETIAQIAQRRNISFLCDGSQAVGKIPIQFAEWGITCLAISVHRFYGPKGVGAMMVCRGHHLESLLFGGGHQQGMRSGTFNVSGIVRLWEACLLRSLEMEDDERAIATKRDILQKRLVETISGLVVNGDQAHRLAGNLHISVPGVPNSAIVARVRHKLALSTGSACSSGVEAPSHVLQSMNLPNELVEGALRIGIGKFTTDKEVTLTAEFLGSAFAQTQELLRSPLFQ